MDLVQLTFRTGEPGEPSAAHRHKVERILRDRLAATETGVVDGGGTGMDGMSDIFMYGEDAEKLWDSIAVLVADMLPDTKVFIRSASGEREFWSMNP